MAARAWLGSTLAAAVVGAAILSGTAGASSRTAELPSLYVNYTMNCTFTITTDSGAPATSIAPGEYEIQVRTPAIFAMIDLSGDLGNPSDMTACRSFVQFALTGPSVNLYTDLQEGDEDYGLLQTTFQPNSTYTAVDDNQPSVARVTFTTTGAGTAPPTLKNPEGTGLGASKGTASQDIVGSDIANSHLLGSLDAIVYASGKLSLSHNGNVVKDLKAGKWTFSVDD